VAVSVPNDGTFYAQREPAAPVTDGMVTLEIHQHTEEELRALASRMRGW
jgi:hypothetical protein